jgi:mono/diheme cytochrome c family protein
LQGVIKLLSWGAAAYFAALTFTLTLAGAQTASPANEPQQKSDAEPALNGKAIYAEKCSHCHGFGMVSAGTVAPDLRKFPDDRPRFFTTVKTGKNNRMPPWGDLLSDEQIEAIWSYASSQRKP